jgi:hypothetical protein
MIAKQFKIKDSEPIASTINIMKINYLIYGIFHAKNGIGRLESKPLGRDQSA